MDIFRAQFGHKLARALHDAGMKQNALAEILDVKDSTVSRWVNGKDFPGGARLPEICEALGVTSEYFTERTPIAESIRETTSLLQGLLERPPKAKNLVFAIATRDDSFLKGFSRESRRLLADLLKSLETESEG